MGFQLAPNQPLLGVVSKIERANRHIRDFNEKAKTFRDQDDLFAFAGQGSPYPSIHYLTLTDMKPSPRERPPQMPVSCRMISGCGRLRALTFR
jgi:hypothetical protein